MNFRIWLENQDYQSLVNWINHQNIDIHQLINQIMKNPPDHRGGNANFWYIPNSEFGLRVIRGNLPSGQLTRQDDDLDMNVGQAIATLGDNVQIVKVQSGNPAGMKIGFQKLNPEEQSKEITNFKNKVFQASQLPQEAYDRLLKQIATLNDKGYSIDASKPGNILIDSDGFNLVDVSQKDMPKKDAGKIIVMLLNNFYFAKYNDPELQAAGRKIIKKIEHASQTTGLPIDKSGATAYSYKLVGL